MTQLVSDLLVWNKKKKKKREKLRRRTGRNPTGLGPWLIVMNRSWFITDKRAPHTVLLLLLLVLAGVPQKTKTTTRKSLITLIAADCGRLYVIYYFFSVARARVCVWSLSLYSGNFPPFCGGWRLWLPRRAAFVFFREVATLLCVKMCYEKSKNARKRIPSVFQNLLPTFFATRWDNVFNCHIVSCLVNSKLTLNLCTDQGFIFLTLSFPAVRLWLSFVYIPINSLRLNFNRWLFFFFLFPLLLRTIPTIRYGDVFSLHSHSRGHSSLKQSKMR